MYADDSDYFPPLRAGIFSKNEKMSRLQKQIAIYVKAISFSRNFVALIPIDWDEILEKEERQKTVAQNNSNLYKNDRICALRISLKYQRNSLII